MSPADVLIFGGSAGSGKTYGLILEALRHHANPEYTGIIFRRTSPQLTGSGSIWEEARKIFEQIGATTLKHPTLQLRFPAGGMLEFRHLQYEDDKFDHQGKQYAFIAFDELTHFTESQFWYLVSRMRSISGIDPYMRCTTNPDPDSFVRKLIDWWIDKNGYPIQKRCGVLRWFARARGEVIWGASKQSVQKTLDACGLSDVRPLSFTFVASKLEDNPALTRVDPRYKSRLQSLPDVERERLLLGNWDVRESAGDFIKPEWLLKRWHLPDNHITTGLKDVLPPLTIFICSDYAVTPAGGGRNPDFTEHGVIGVDSDDNWWILDWWHGQTTPDVWVESLLDLVAKWRPLKVFGESGPIRRSVEPMLRKRMIERQTYALLEWMPTTSGQSNEALSRVGYDNKSKQAKARKGRSFQARAALGKILLHPNAPWVERIVNQLVGFPAVRYDDAFDVFALMGLAADQAFAARPEDSPASRGSSDYDRDDDDDPVNDWMLA